MSDTKRMGIVAAAKHVVAVLDPCNSTGFLEHDPAFVGAYVTSTSQNYPLAMKDIKTIFLTNSPG